MDGGWALNTPTHPCVPPATELVTTAVADLIGQRRRGERWDHRRDAFPFQRLRVPVLLDARRVVDVLQA